MESEGCLLDPDVDGNAGGGQEVVNRSVLPSKIGGAAVRETKVRVLVRARSGCVRDVDARGVAVLKRRREGYGRTRVLKSALAWRPPPLDAAIEEALQNGDQEVEVSPDR